MKGIGRRLEKYGHTKLLRQVKGVGPITALAYVLTLENPEHFAKSREVGPYLGLVPSPMTPMSISGISCMMSRGIDVSSPPPTTIGVCGARARARRQICLTCP